MSLTAATVITREIEERRCVDVLHGMFMFVSEQPRFSIANADTKKKREAAGKFSKLEFWKKLSVIRKYTPPPRWYTGLERIRCIVEEMERSNLKN